MIYYRSSIPCMTSDLLGQFVQPVLLENHFVYINDLVNIVAAGFALFNSKQLAGLPINPFPAHSQGISYSRVTALLEEEFAITSGDVSPGVTKIHYSCYSLPADRERGTR